MTRIILNIYHYFKDHRVVYWGSLVALFAFFGYFASQIYLEEDLNKLMPSSKNPDGTTKLAFADLKIKDKVFVLFQGKKGTSTDHIAAHVEKGIRRSGIFSTSCLRMPYTMRSTI